MVKDDRTIIERLDDIENKIPTFKYEDQKPISEVIGRPFEDYLNEATIYEYEEDIRKFKRAIKKQRTMPVILLLILFFILIFNIVSLVINKQLEWLLVVSNSLALISPILTIIALSKQKNKQPVYSFWNVKNTEFYLTKDGDHKKIVSEENNGAVFYVLLITKIISIVVCFGGVLWYFIASLQTTTNTVLFWVGSILGYLTALSNVITIKIKKPYNFHNYIIETEDSYMTYPGLDYFKK